MVLLVNARDSSVLVLVVDGSVMSPLSLRLPIPEEESGRGDLSPLLLLLILVLLTKRVQRGLYDIVGDQARPGASDDEAGSLF